MKKSKLLFLCIVQICFITNYLTSINAAAISLDDVLIKGGIIRGSAPQISNIGSTISRINLGSGIISGEYVNFYFNIPAIWQEYLVADREKITKRGRPIERLHFNFKPSNNEGKLARFMILEIYDKSNYIVPPTFRKLLLTEKYVFTVWIGDGGTLTNDKDKSIFEMLEEYASYDRNLLGLIRLLSDDRIIYENTVWVNGKQLNTKTIVDENVTYLPIREISEMLGYSVDWVEKENSIALSRGEFNDVLSLSDMSLNDGFVIMMKNERSYIASLFFITHMKLYVEIDENANVVIIEI